MSRKRHGTWKCFTLPPCCIARKDNKHGRTIRDFTDADANVRFRLLGADGTVLAISKAFEDKRAAADGIMAVRECAGTGLIKEARSNAWGGTGRTRAGLPKPAHRRHRHIPAV